MSILWFKSRLHLQFFQARQPGECVLCHVSKGIVAEEKSAEIGGSLESEGVQSRQLIAKQKQFPKRGRSSEHPWR